jgi:hypothetical protein
MALTLILGTSIVVMLPFSINGGDAVKSSDWIGFAGNVLAGVMTLIAAIVAWAAVQKQIEAGKESDERKRQHERDEKTRECDEAKFAATIVLTQPVHAAATVLNVAGQVLEAAAGGSGGPMAESVRPKLIAESKKKYDGAMRALRATMDHFAIAQAWQGLSIDDRTNYLIVTATLHTIVTIHDHPPPIDAIENIRNQYATLTKLGIYLRAFDEELADVFLLDSTA